MTRADGTGKRKILDIDRGLFLVRYSDAEDGEQPPIVKISVDHRVGDDHVIISHPDAEDGVLSTPGTSLAVRAASPAKLLVQVLPRIDGGSTAATVKVEALNAGEATAEVLSAETKSRTAIDFDGLRIHGHIAGQGDVVVHRDEWLAGPAAPSRVEGFMIDWPKKPEGLDIRYAVKFARPQAGSNQMTDIGKFAGTRGRALPVTGIVLELGGEDAAGYELSVEALFLGSPAIRSTGRRVVVNGPTSRETLVGLRVNVDVPGRPTRTSAIAEPKSKPTNKVQVFRGRQKAAQPTA